jgi:putative phosphoesterase
MQIGVLSDTHLSKTPGMMSSIKQAVRNTRSIATLRTLLVHHFRGVDLIIHTGDFVDLAVLDMLQELAPVEAVQGNMDLAEIRTRLPDQKTLQVGGFKIGITHGNGAPTGILDRVKGRFADVQVIVFGHTHQPMNEVQEGILFFNPGSPTDRIFAPYNALGILEVSAQITGKIIRV